MSNISPFLVSFSYDELPFFYDAAMAFDEGDFNESDHPRDAGGKFTSGSGSSGGSTESFSVTNHIKSVLKEAGYKPAKDWKNPKKVVFKHPSGAQIEIHPPAPGKKFSSAWTSEKPGWTTKTGEGINGISQLLQKAVTKAESSPAGEKPKIDVTPPSSSGIIEKGFNSDLDGTGIEGKMDAGSGLVKFTSAKGGGYWNPKSGMWTHEDGTSGKGLTELKEQHGLSYPNTEEELNTGHEDPSYNALAEKHIPHEVLKKSGFVFNDEKSDPDDHKDVYNMSQQGEDLELTINVKSGAWAVEDVVSGAMKEGHGKESLAEIAQYIADGSGELEDYETGANEPDPEVEQYQKEEAEKKTPVSTTLLPPKDMLLAKGYKYSNMKYNDKGQGEVTVYQDGAKSVEFSLMNGDWLVQTPGYQTKKGNGEADLTKLLNGEKAYEKDGGGYSWNNSSETSLQVGEKAVAPAPKPKPETTPSSGPTDKEVMKKNQTATLSHLNSIAPKPTDPETSAISSYTNGAYASLNSNLRNGKPLKGSHGAVQKNLDSYLAKSTFDKDVQLHRKVDGPFATMIKNLATAAKGMPPGIVRFMDRGYQSTSTHSGVWHGSVHMVINVKKGQKGASVKQWSNHAGENEVILPRNTMIAIQKVEADGTIHVTLDQAHHGVVKE